MNLNNTPLTRAALKKNEQQNLLGQNLGPLPKSWNILYIIFEKILNSKGADSDRRDFLLNMSRIDLNNTFETRLLIGKELLLEGTWMSQQVSKWVITYL